MRVAVELADQSIAVLLGPVGQLLDEVLDLFPARLSEGLRSAEVDGVGLDEFGIEFVLTDNLAETVSHLRAGSISVSIGVLGRKLLIRTRDRPDLLDRADADAIGLAQGAIDCPGFGHAHLGPADQRGNVGRIRVAVADEARGVLGWIDGCL